MTYQVIVTGLPVTVNEDDVRDFFMRVGDVEDVQISKDETVICFRTEQDMEEALQINGMEFNENVVVTVQRANEPNKNTDVKETHNDKLNVNEDEQSTLEKRRNYYAEKNQGNSHEQDNENDNNNNNEEKSEEDRRRAELLSWSVPEVNKVVVKNLTVSTTEQQLRELFKSCGEILDFYLAPGGHHAFIGFHENDGVDAALKLNGTDLNGTAIFVETKWTKSTSRSKNSFNSTLRSDDYRRDVYSSNNNRVSGREGRIGFSGYTKSSDFEDTRIIVKNLPTDFTEEEVRDVLRGCGRIVDYYPNHDKCYTFIAFDHARAVPIALNRDGAEIRGVKVTVERRVDPKRGVKSSTEFALHDKLHNDDNNNKPSLSTIRCHKCQELGHFVRDCPEGALSSTPDYTHSRRGAVNLIRTSMTRLDASNYPFAPTQRVSRLPRSQLERAERIGENTAIHRTGSDRSNRPPDYRESVLRIAKTTPMPPPPSYKTQREERGVNYSHRLSEKVATTSRYGDMSYNDGKKEDNIEEKRQNRYRPLSSNEDRRREINKYDDHDNDDNTNKRFTPYDEADKKIQHSRLEYSNNTSSRAAVGVSSADNESRAVHRSLSKTNYKESPRHQYHDNNRAKRDKSYSASRSNSTSSCSSRSRSNTNDTARSGSNEKNRRKRRRSEAQNRSTQEKEGSYHNHHKHEHQHHNHHHHHVDRNEKRHKSNSQHYNPSALNTKTHSEKEKCEYPNEMKSSPKYYDYNHHSYDKGNAHERRYDVQEGTSRVRAGTSNSRLPPPTLQESSALSKSGATRSTYPDAFNAKSSIPLQRYTRDDVPRRRSPSLERYKTINSRNRADEARRRSRSPPYTRERNVPRYE